RVVSAPPLALAAVLLPAARTPMTLHPRRTTGIVGDDVGVWRPASLLLRGRRPLPELRGARLEPEDGLALAHRLDRRGLLLSRPQSDLARDLAAHGRPPHLGDLPHRLWLDDALQRQRAVGALRVPLHRPGDVDDR